MLLLAGTVMQAEITGTTPNSTFTHFALVNSTQLICTATYAINRALVTTNTSQLPANVEILSSFPNRTLANVNGTDIQNVFWSVGGAVVLDAATAQDGILSPTDLNNRLMTSSPDALVNVTQNYFQSLLAQTARITLLGPDNTTIKGTAIAFDDGLVLRNVSVRIIEVHLILLLISAVAMIFLIPRTGVVPHDPGSVGGLSILISGSNDLKKSLAGMGPSPSRHIQDRISGYGYQTKSSLEGGQYTFSIEVYPDKQERSTPVPNADTIEWWRPFGATKYAHALAISSAISVVIALELILRDSEWHTGLVDLDPTGYAHYATAYIPALTMVGIGLLFANLDIATKVFAPFSKLKSGTAAGHDLFTNPLKYTTFEALWFSVRTRNLAVLCTTIAAFLSSFLTIAVSGVYVVEKVPSSQPLDLSMLTAFNSSPAAVVGGVTEPFTLAALVEVGNLSFPAWTYGELALASYGLETSNLDADMVRFSAPIPAMRARMDCTLYTKEQLNTSLTFRPATSFVDTENPLSVIAPMTAIQERSFCTQNLTFTVQRNSVFGHYQSRPHWPCSNWYYVWGNIGASSVEDVAAMTCFEDVETLMVNTTLILPSLAIDPTQPPIPDESTTRWFNNFTSNTGYSILTNIRSGGAMSNQTILQDFFQLLVAGNQPPPLTAFSDLTTNMSDAILHLHKVLKAQVYGYSGDGSLRINTTGHPTLTGTASNLNRERLVRSVASTRILQALLVVMALCILIQSFLVDKREVLPKDPRSVAGLASLLVESEMLELVKG